MAEAEDDDRAKEIETLNEFIKDLRGSLDYKEALRKENGAPDNRPEEEDLRRLDSSLKKNTAFIRKLRNYTDNHKETVKKDIKSLNLSKYMGEVTAALVEAKYKMTDLSGVIEICGLLHRTYAEFSSSLLEAWARVMSFSKKDTTVPNPSKLRVDLRLYAELISFGVFTLKEGLPLLGNVLTTLIHMDKESHVHISIIISFCKYCGMDYADLLPRKIRILSEAHRYEIPSSTLLPADKRKNVRTMLRDYFASLSRHLHKDKAELKSLEATNQKILMTKGEVQPDRIDKVEKASSNFSKLLSNAEQLAEILDEDMPQLSSDDQKDTNNDLEAGRMNEGSESGIDPSIMNKDAVELWEDEDSRKFYEDLVDLKAFIPAVLYKDSSAVTEEPVKDIIEDVEEESLGEAEAIIDVEDEPPPEVEEEPDDDPSTQNVSNKMLLEAFLANILTCINKEMIDSAAVDFCMNLNTKKNRTKLVKSLFGVHRNRQDLLPFFARLVATLAPCMPEIPSELGKYLKKEFRWQLRKKDQMKIESKLKVVRFIGELVKFKIFPKSEALFCLKLLIFDFSHHHIEMACTLMETAGRYLYRTKESHQQTKIYLEQMMRKKQAVMSADSRYSMMIENAFYTVCPPDHASNSNQVQLPPLHQYVRKLLFKDLSSSNVLAIAKKLMKLNWESKEESGMVIRYLGQVWNLKFHNLHDMAFLLQGMSSYDWVVQQVIDGILENIRLGMEINNSKFNQRRLAVVSFLGELYIYRLVDSQVVFKVLYSLITFGAGDPVLDPPNQTIRIRLTCILLNTCSSYFWNSSTKERLRCFLAYFQLYYWRKISFFDDERQFPFAIKNLMNETLSSISKDYKKVESLKEAEGEVARVEREAMKDLKKNAPAFYEDYFKRLKYEENQNEDGLRCIVEEDEDGDEKSVNPSKVESEEELDEEDEDEEEAFAKSRESQEEDDEEDEEEISQFQEDVSHGDDDEEDDDDFDEEDEEEFIKDESLNLISKTERVECPEDDEFVQMFDRMLNENISETRGLRGQQGDISVPMQIKQNRSKPFDSSKIASSIEEDKSIVQFSVLLRKPQGGGNKQFYRQLDVPADSDLAKNLLKQEEEARREKERVKQLTLQINERQEEEDMLEDVSSIFRTDTNKDGRRGGKFHHQRGAPDNSAIFGSKR